MMTKLITATTLARTMPRGSTRTPNPMRIGCSIHARVCSTGSSSGCRSLGSRLRAAAAAANEKATAPRSRTRGWTRASSGVSAAPARGAPMQIQAASVVTAPPRPRRARPAARA